MFFTIIALSLVKFQQVHGNAQLKEDARLLSQNAQSLQDLYSQHIISKQKSIQSDLETLLKLVHDDTTNNKPTSGPKHVLTILSDDQGYADIGYNDDTMVTPTLDFFSSKGIRFTNFYVQSTCTPTRASLLTGKYAGKTGIHDVPVIPGESRHLPLDFKTTGNYFKESGRDYSTYFIGKWHLGYRTESLLPTSRGYDYYFGVLGGAVDHYNKTIGNRCGSEENNFTPFFADNCQVMNAYDLMENGVPHLDTENYTGYILADTAVATIEKHDATKPFLMHFHLTAPHTPMQAPKALIDLCKDVSTGPPDVLQPYFRQILCGMVASVDLNVLQVILALYAKDMLSNTLILFHSDNGGFTLAGSLNTPFRGAKAELWEGGVHVPAFMYGQGLSAGEVTGLFHVSDVLPTLLSYADIDYEPDNFDGMSHWNNLKNNLPLSRNFVNVEAYGRLLAYASAYIHQFSANETWKYILNPTPLSFVFYRKDPNLLFNVEGEMLFHLTADPSESHNLAFSTDSKHQEILSLLRQESIYYRSLIVPSQLTSWPPTIDILPSELGCWLSLDSPLFETFDCNLRPVIPKNWNATRTPVSVVKSINSYSYALSYEQIVDAA